MGERRKAANQEEGTKAGLWMVTFSDLVMLLLTFFVLLISMSSLDTKKLKSLFTHFKQATGALEFSSLRAVPDLARFISAYNNSEGLVVVDQSRLSDMIIPFKGTDEELDDMLRSLRDKIRIMDDERGIVLTFPNRILFRPGEAEIRKDLLSFLDCIAAIIGSCPNDILVVGHTDDTPLAKGKYRSNWELSLYRALSVIDYFINVKGLPPHRFSVGAAGPSRPLYPNDTQENRALNRRVEIIFRHL
ncbi:MAG: OmpA family protein [Deltaproteobacteria bacterium]|nr:OmpA family protein [Deltaproteobacteria bacterium]MBW2139052.1 OmpA family protein [Deltaproteobacteria bacterium]